ncbi:LLM class flavin-dependent oxidoreductase [Nitriliruptor alkaliphilus]|uniref:LLM class flavin-dependent oxidoreductase n=1 Tax=Nitriliruptor alkaliphilus TaxID=427918 RepID=UPI000695AFE6|nr:LLM class flavin-dependent oxidoreductase [Nitriliruptor alkaliphilus]
MDVGIGISEDLPVAVQQQLAVDVEGAGFRSLWTNEASGRDALLLCQAWAAATATLEVGVGVVPLWTRSPAQLAMACATLQEATGGRFILGLGVSHPATMGPWHGADVRAPRTAAREALTILRQLEAGEPSDVDGQVMRSSRFRLRISPQPPPTTRLLAAMGPRMLELAGTDADGVLLNWSSAEEVARAGQRVRSAAADAGRDPAGVEVATYVRVAVADDHDTALTALAGEIATYAALPAYAAHFERQGFGDAVERVKAAHKAGADAAGKAEALGERALSQLGWAGTPQDDPADALAAYRDAGLDHLVARVVVAGGDAAASVHQVVRALG